LNKKEFYSKYLNNPANRMFFENTLIAIKEGKVVIKHKIGSNWLLKKKGIDGLMMLYVPHKLSIYSYFFDNYKPLPGEYLITVGGGEDDKIFGIHSWVFLTNYRVLQRDGKTKKYYMIPFDRLIDYKMEGGKWTAKLTFKMDGGHTTTCEKVESWIPEEMLLFLASEKEWIQYNVKPSEPNVQNFKYCTECRTSNNPDSNYCIKCGSKLQYRRKKYEKNNCNCNYCNVA